MKELQEYQKIVEKKIGQLDLPQDPANLYEPLRYFLKLGGKRTRPSLTMLGCSLFNVPGLKALNAALAVELFHNFTLIHDDIMDEAPLRRGQETVHQKWNTNIGILSGDVLFVEAYDHLAKYEGEVLAQLLSIFSRTARQVCEGQQLDMDFETQKVVSIPAYIEMIRLKTSVLLGAALEMGATVANANQKDLEHLYDFGVNIGLAFQMQDDLLDVYADPEKFGKQVGGDILANKKTYLLLKAFERASEEQRAALNDSMEHTNGEEKIAAVKRIFAELDVRDHAEREKKHFYDAAIKHLEAVDVPSRQKETLIGLAGFIMARDH
ncbi:MAG: polyprenyl synthetase family protein [Bacteroidota bacterium]